MVIVLAYIIANLTRWTTHYIAFAHLLHLKDALKFAVLRHRGAIIDAQVGAAKSAEAKRLKEEAKMMCELVDDSRFWNGLEHLVGDIEPICFGTNINQCDSTWADQVLLTLAGKWLHFGGHPEPEVSLAMMARVERRFMNCDQLFFLVTLILNPFQGLAPFGPNAGLGHFTCNSMVISVCF